jgi:hypothetical protein
MATYSFSLTSPPEFQTREKTIRHTFTAEEDALLVEIVTQSPKVSWHAVAASIPGRTARQCRERWAEYLRPGIRVEPWTEEEDEVLLQQVELHGHRWTAIATAFARRSANDVKNRWYSHLRCCVFVTGNGRLEFVRTYDGSRIPGKPKRRRTQSMPGKTALLTVETKRLDELKAAGDRPPRVWFPQLCPAEMEKLPINFLKDTR